MRALLLNCSLKPSPAASSTQALADVVVRALEEAGVDIEVVRVIDLTSHLASRRISARVTTGHGSTSR